MHGSCARTITRLLLVVTRASFTAQDIEGGFTLRSEATSNPTIVAASLMVDTRQPRDGAASSLHAATALLAPYLVQAGPLHQWLLPWLYAQASSSADRSTGLLQTLRPWLLPQSLSHSEGHGHVLSRRSYDFRTARKPLETTPCGQPVRAQPTNLDTSEGQVVDEWKDVGGPCLQCGHP